MYYIALLFKCNALHYTLLFTNFKQTKLVHIDIFITSGVNNKPVTGFLFVFGINNKIRKEYLGTDN